MNTDRRRRPGAGRLILAALGSALFLAACSEETPVRLPIGSTLALSPEENRWRIADRRDELGRCFIDEADYVDLPILVALRDGGGVPVGEADVGLYVNLADNTYSGFPVVQLYDDLNSNGVIDADAELVSGAEDERATVRTSKYGGDRLMLMRVNLSCPFRSGVFAFSEGYSALASVEVVLECEDDPGGCPDPGE